METAKYILDTLHNETMAFSLIVFRYMSSKHDYADYDQFIPNFNMVCKKLTSLPNLKSFGPMKTELWTKEV